VAEYRYLGKTPAFVDVGGIATVLVKPGDVVNIDDRDRYVQTGATGETPLFEAVVAKKSTKKEG